MNNLENIYETLDLQGSSFTVSRKTILDLRGTKVFCVSFGVQTYYITTWSSLVRTVVQHLQLPILDLINRLGIEKLNNKYKIIMQQLLDQTDMKLNSNCPIGIYKKEEINNYINSSVYLNNKNHSLKLFTLDGIDYSICAVYTGEIIYNIQTLLELLYTELGLSITVTIKYADRKNYEQYLYNKKYDDKSTEYSDTETDLSTDLIALATYTKKIQNIIMDLSKKYNIDITNDVISEIYDK